MGKYKLAIFASGNGSNAEAIIKHFLDNPSIEISAIYSNNKNAYVLERGKKYNIHCSVFNKTTFNSAQFNQHLINEAYDFIILAGFMWLVPPAIIRSYPNKILNIHPALLPKYGGKGMYGHFVHEAVLQHQEHESGITIHFVNEQYDKGDILFQATCPVHATDSPDSLAERIHLLEHRHYPQVIEKLCPEKS